MNKQNTDDHYFLVKEPNSPHKITDSEWEFNGISKTDIELNDVDNTDRSEHVGDMFDKNKFTHVWGLCIICVIGISLIIYASMKLLGWVVLIK